MTIDGLYDMVCSVHPTDRYSFEEDLSFAAGELCAMFGKKNVLPEDGVTQSLPVKEEYGAALCSAILFIERGEQEDRQRFLERARSAFLEVWRQRARIRKKGGA